MFDIGWSEMAVVAFLALLIIGPKELPNVMKNVARWVKKARSLSREFQSGVDEMVREAELEDARKALEQTTPNSINQSIGNVVDPSGSVQSALNDVEKEAKATPTSASPSESSETSAPASGETETPEVAEPANPNSILAQAAATASQTAASSQSADTPEADAGATGPDPAETDRDGPKTAGSSA